jgi:hypothetical protein
MTGTGEGKHFTTTRRGPCKVCILSTSIKGIKHFHVTGCLRPFISVFKQQLSGIQNCDLFTWLLEGTVILPLRAINFNSRYLSRTKEAPVSSQSDLR